VHILVTDRFVDHIAEGVDLVFRLGPLKDSSLIARKLLTYRHQLVASPAYLVRVKSPEKPQDPAWTPAARLLALENGKQLDLRRRERC
jgi:DNA-binding transcriptional LysR family regulator